nr:type VI secretion system baseplate subunit TssG [uncultured Pseudomonas sp.]
MAREDRSTAPAVSPDRLLSEGRDYAFFQALRLLRLRLAGDQGFADNVRIRPRLGLGFPERDIEHVARDNEGRYHLEANFFGLYGVTSPLPTFYTEDLIDEQLQGRSASRDLLDVLHAALYPLLFRAWEKHRLWMSIAERRDLGRLNLLRTLVGLADAGPQWQQHAPEMLRYAGIFNQFPRSALGLEQLITTALDGERVEVVPCVPTQVPIDEQARCLLGLQGNALGQDSLLGRHVADRATTLDIRVGPLSALRFHLLLPGAGLFKRIERLTALYLQTPLKCRLVLSVEQDEQRSPALGNGWQRLGLNTWLGDAAAQGDVVFVLAGAQSPASQSRSRP